MYIYADKEFPGTIIDKTMGRVHGDHQYLRRMEKEWVRQYDQVMMEVRDSRNWKEKVLEFLERTEGEWRLDASRY
ncbi:MAG: hypothetical protein KH452_10065 [Clostridiales bacterium]|nr:hypothetical protein [Clostridiales bacterium]